MKNQVVPLASLTPPRTPASIPGYLASRLCLDHFLRLTSYSHRSAWFTSTHMLLPGHSKTASNACSFVLHGDCSPLGITFVVLSLVVRLVCVCGFRVVNVVRRVVVRFVVVGALVVCPNGVFLGPYFIELIFKKKIPKSILIKLKITVNRPYSKDIVHIKIKRIHRHIAGIVRKHESTPLFRVIQTKCMSNLVSRHQSKIRTLPCMLREMLRLIEMDLPMLRKKGVCQNTALFPKKHL